MRTPLYLAVAVSLVGLACQGNVSISSERSEAQTSPPAGSARDGRPTVLDPSTPEGEPDTQGSAQVEEPEPVYEVPSFTGEQLVSYLHAISQMLISRPPSEAEVAAVERDGVDAMRPMLRAWASEPGFSANARYLMQQKLKASGARDGIDFELPGNLIAHVVREELPWSTILTADYCVDRDGATIPCDTGAPFAAGVLGTRAFLAGNASRFNLGRANRMLNVFACRVYPMEAELQPYLVRESLIPMFQANSIEEQTVDEAAGGFGNGSGCYTCHGQFGAHAQLFVKFDETGMYRADATGLQDPEGELGRSIDGLMASHFTDTTQAADEASQLFGDQVANLAEAARTLVQAEPFLPCQAKAIIQHTFGLSESAAIDPEMLRAIARQALALNADPTYTDLVVATFSEPRVILSVVGSEPSAGGNQ